MSLDPIFLGILIFSALFTFIILGVPIAFALIITSLGGIYFLLGTQGLSMVALHGWDSITPFVLNCVPLYLLLGTIFGHSGLAARLYEGIYKWFSWLPGSLAITTTISAGIFSAISGSSVATAAIFSKISVPAMLKRKYKESFASASVAVGGTLGILIPPSIPLILYGVVVEESIGALFLAGIIPGIMLVTIFSLYEFFFTLKYNPKTFQNEAFSLKEKILALKEILPFMIVIFLVIVSIYVGFATPTEAAALSVIITLILAMLIYRVLTFKGLYLALKEAVRATAMIVFIIMGAMLFGYLLTAMYIPQTIAESISELEVSRWWILISINIFFLFLGMFLEVVSIIVITAPIIVPIITNLGWDPVWFGIIMTINMEIALITPPVGLNLFVVKEALPYIQFSSILRGVAPFIVLLLFAIALISIFPDIALWLPNQMG